MSAFFDSIFGGAVEKFTWSWKMGKNVDNRVNLPTGEFTFQDWINSLHNVFHVLDNSLYKRSLISENRMIFMNSDMLRMVSFMHGCCQNKNGIGFTLNCAWSIIEEPDFPKVLIVNRNVLDAIRTGMYATIDVIDWDQIPDEYQKK